MTRVAIIGERGRMGAMLMRRLARPGFVETRGADLPLTPEALHAAIDGADIVLCCVPAAAMEEVVRLCMPHMREDAVLSDIVSVKVQPMSVMEKLWPGPCVGTHPLFGPAPAPDLELSVCLTPGSRATDAHVELVRDLFSGMGAECFVSNAEEHDRSVGLIQGINFVTSAAYFALLTEFKDLDRYITPSFVRRQEAARKLLTEDGELFTWLFEANPFAHESVRKYRSMLNLAAGGDVDLLLQKARAWFKTH